MKRISNREDLLAYFGARDEAHFQRLLYKRTDCGASVHFLAPGRQRVGTRVEVWSARILGAAGGAYCPMVRRRGRAGQPQREAPEYVKAYLHLDANGSMDVPWELIRELRAGENGVLRVTWQRGCVMVTFEVVAPVWKAHTGGVAIGSIVEGSDAEVPARELYYPFSSERLEAVIQAVEEEADALWCDAYKEEA